MGARGAACAVVFVAATFAYLNTLPASFAFDDSFAVVRCGGGA
jgi:hypothetical protein